MQQAAPISLEVHCVLVPLGLLAPLGGPLAQEVQALPYVLPLLAALVLHLALEAPAINTVN